jgi:hypothetical protein
VLVAVVFALAVLLGLALRSMWRHRRVDFIHHVAAGIGADVGAAELFDQVVPVLVRDGFRTIANAGHTTVFERRSSLIGPILISIVLFPFGLIALLWRTRETVTFVSAGATIDLYGYCSKPIADYLVAVAEDVAARREHVR